MRGLQTNLASNQLFHVDPLFPQLIMSLFCVYMELCIKMVFHRLSFRSNNIFRSLCTSVTGTHPVPIPVYVEGKSDQRVILSLCRLQQAGILYFDDFTVSDKV